MAHYANECANNSARKRSAQAGRAFCAPCAYLYATIDRAHSYVVLNSHSTDLSYHVYRSVLCDHHGVYRRYIILPFVADGKISPSRAHVAALAPFPHFSYQFLHPLRLSSICFFVVKQTKKQRREERRTKRASNPPIHLTDNP